MFTVLNMTFDYYTYMYVSKTNSAKYQYKYKISQKKLTKSFENFRFCECFR
jgi:hypothetical protein